MIPFRAGGSLHGSDSVVRNDRAVRTGNNADGHVPAARYRPAQQIGSITQRISGIPDAITRCGFEAGTAPEYLGHTAVRDSRLLRDIVDCW